MTNLSFINSDNAEFQRFQAFRRYCWWKNHVLSLTENNVGVYTSKKRVLVSLFLEYHMYAKPKMIQLVILELLLTKEYSNPISNRSLTLFLSCVFLFPKNQNIRANTLGNTYQRILKSNLLTSISDQAHPK